MDLATVSSIMREGIFTTITIAGPVLLVAMVIGLVVAIFQATTSIQDQTLTFVPKILAILITIAILGAWMINRMGDFTTSIFNMIPDMVK